MLTRFFYFFILFFSIQICAQTKKISGFASPESVCVVGKNIFVSNVGKALKPMEKDGDGFLSKLDMLGNIIELEWIKNLNAPKGIANIDNTLFVADIDKIICINISDKKIIKEILIENVQFLNGITVKDKQHIYVSATDADAIFEINTKTYSVSKTNYKGVQGVNGLHYQKSTKRLYAVGFGNGIDNYKNGRIGYFNTKDADYLPVFISNLYGYFDGIKIKGKYAYVSDWGNNYSEGRVLRVDLKKGWVNNFAELSGPADFCMHKKRLFIPEMKKGNVYFLNPKDFFKLFK